MIEVTWAEITAPTTVTIEIAARVKDEPAYFAGQTHTNNAQIQFTFEGNIYNDSDSADVGLIEPDITGFSKEFHGGDPNPVAGGDEVYFRVEFDNTGTSTAYNIAWADILPEEMRDAAPVVEAVEIYDLPGPVFNRALSPPGDYTVTWTADSGALDIDFLTPAVGSSARLEPDERMVIYYRAFVDYDVGSFSEFSNFAEIPTDGYFSLPPDPANPDIRSYYDGDDSLDLDTSALAIEKTSLWTGQTGPTIGETVYYRLEVTVPAETVAYWPQISDIVHSDGLYYLPGSTTFSEVTGYPAEPVSFFSSTEPDWVTYTYPVPGMTATWGLNPIVNASDGTPWGDIDYVFALEFGLLVTGLEDGGGDTEWKPPLGGQFYLDDGRIDWSSFSDGPGSTDRFTEDTDIRTDVEQPVLSASDKSTTTVNPVQGGQTVYYRVTFDNTGWNTAFDTVITDLIPVGMRGTSPAVDSIDVDGRSLTGSGVDYDTTWSGQTYTFTFISTDTSLPVSSNTSDSRIEVGETVTIDYHVFVDATVGAGQ